MYSPIDKAKAVWLCVTLIVLFILVVCIVLPIAVTQPQSVQDTCIWDDECLDQSIRKTKTIENLETDLSNPDLISVSTTEKSKGLSSISLTTTVSPRTDPQLTDPQLLHQPPHLRISVTRQFVAHLALLDAQILHLPTFQLRVVQQLVIKRVHLDVKKIWMNLKLFDVLWIC